ncbi:hypothetical protein GA0111570_11611 [Raineyella antarctica]|uniref:Uncharacterized protein n=1 Tax=Raineyella antarctica TaxID=1577474 RepID=A0A1G6IF71_9ACTN|nr:hypothetical protein [Raineyella antarctica]SDC05033.1 hypothetical protein GA0111570_11611 [Raineyella antarctica]
MPGDDWSDAGARILRSTAATTTVLESGAASTGALLPGSPGSEAVAGTKPLTAADIRPFDASERALWAVQRGVVAALGDDGRRLQEALPGAEEAGAFSLGVVEGVGDAVQDIVRDRVRLILSGITSVVDFYAFVYDISLWVELISAWTAPQGTGIEGVVDRIKQDHPALYEAMRNFRTLVRKFDELTASLTDTSQPGNFNWTRAQAYVADWLVDLPGVLGQLLRPSVDQLVADRGDPQAQGRTIGRVLARVIIEAVLLAMDLYALVRGAAHLASDVLRAVRESLSATELATAAARAEKAAPGIIATGKGTSGAAREAQQIYEELATEIRAYDRLKRKTGAFNSAVRDIAGLKVSDTGYIAMRLDAQHIVEATWFEKHAAEFKRVFGWEASGDMDAIALHTEWHIRSGEKLATNLNLLGAEKEVSLTKKLQDFLKARQTAPDGSVKPFANLTELFQAHADFYRDYSPRLSQRLDGWFAQRLAQIAAAGSPP